MRKAFSYLAMTSCFVLGTTLAHADTDAHHGKMVGKIQEKMFKAMDANSDGMVTVDEFNAFHTKKFKELDINGDGQITLEEMKAGHKKMMDGSRHKKMGHAWHKKTDDAEGKKMDDSKMGSDSGKAHPQSDTANPKSETRSAGDSSNSCCWTPRNSDAN
ncbi:MAG: EF hand [Candidatus Nitrotoga sp. LAW]|nr:MAG: EF hand [Candidatus Nitrotoga sp. LAW]